MSAAGQPGVRPAEGAVEAASELMRGFAERTGLGSAGPPRRYLWTDAFAVCNYLALWRATGGDHYRQLAVALVDQVHHVLGRHRPDDTRRGWISGLADREGEVHPTRGGLRIGKELPERPPGVPIDERLEWDRDGQYFHYLTRWMHALDQVARATGETRYNTWARELAAVAHAAFRRGSGAGRAMVWKLSIDLSRPLVSSMGQHDPLDGLVTCLQLRATAASLSDAPLEPDLDAAVSELAALAGSCVWATADPLGLGGLLIDAGRVAQLEAQRSDAVGARLEARETALLEALLAAALEGLAHFARRNDLGEPAARRLAFRELGLAIGLAALGPLERAVSAAGSGFPEGVRARLQALAPHAALGPAIVAFWRDPLRRRTPGWIGHADINDVMLATCLVPEGALRLAPVR